MAWRNKGTGQISHSSTNPGTIYGSGQYVSGTWNNGMDANVWEQVHTPASATPSWPDQPAVSSAARGYAPEGPFGRFCRRFFLAILAIGAVIVLIGRDRASEQERGWAAVRAQQAEAARRVLADPRQRKIQHDLWLQGQAYRKWEKEHIRGVVLGPNPPEPPK